MKQVKITSLLLIMLLMSGCVKQGEDLTENKNFDYIEQISTLTKKLSEATNEKNELKDELSKQESDSLLTGTCTFVTTFRVIEVMNYQTTDDESKFVVLDQFQESEPFIVNIKKAQASKLSKNLIYEFSFVGDKKYRKSQTIDLFKKYELDNIKLTDKVGLEQLQEECR